MLQDLEKNIEYYIYEIRGKQVMLDSDLAKLYGCKNGTKTINQAVKRHIDRFPGDFYFQLTEKEVAIVASRSQIGTLNKSSNSRGSNVKYLPFVFTEEGVSMLASVLKTENASIVSVNIMRAFVHMRHLIKDNVFLLDSNINILNKLSDHERKLTIHDEKLLELFSKFDNPEESELIYFNGQIYDAYSKIVDIMKLAKNELIIIDSYADKSVLDMVSKIDVKVILILRKDANLSAIDIEKYNNQYDNLKLVYNNSFHDRYIIIDRKKVYHCGASFNHAGKRTFGINKLQDENIIILLIKNLENIIA